MSPENGREPRYKRLKQAKCYYPNALILRFKCNSKTVFPITNPYVVTNHAVPLPNSWFKSVFYLIGFYARAVFPS